MSTNGVADFAPSLVLLRDEMAAAKVTGLSFSEAVGPTPVLNDEVHTAAGSPGAAIADSGSINGRSISPNSKVRTDLLDASRLASTPAIVIPPPHLPLRKQASGGLRLRTSAQSSRESNAPSQSVGSMAKKLRPETIRWSKEDIVGMGAFMGDSHRSSTSPKSSARSKKISRTVTALDAPEEEDGADTLSPLIRPTTLINDHHLSRPSLRTSTSDIFADRGTRSLRDSAGNPSPRTPSSFWRDGGVSNVRESIMSSTFTNGSSAINTSGSSVFTARSSRSTRDSSGLEWQQMSDDELSVDDCIDMYANGFKDDVNERSPTAELAMEVSSASPSPSGGPSVQATLIRSSSSLHKDCPGVESRMSDAGLSLHSTSQATSRSDETVSASIGRESHVGLPLNPRRGQKPARDCYGFKHESPHVSANRYTAWYKDYERHLQRRRQKWIYLMNTSGLHSSTFPEIFPPRSSEVKRFIRKGIPPEWRGAAWFFYGGGASWLEAHRGVYDDLLTQAAEGAVKASDRDHIERDLNRTFPDNIYFKADRASTLSTLSIPAPEEEPKMIKSLRRVLEAYAIYHPNVGYCQSLNFLAGHLLLFMHLSFRQRNFEERAFAMLCILTEKYLPGTHGVVLEGANVDIGVLMTILQETMPSLWAKLNDDGAGGGGLQSPHGANGLRKSSARSSVTLKTNTDRLPTVSLATTAWFMSCFVSTLPVESTCRVWDCLWYEGSKTIFRVALAIFKMGERQIKKATDPMEVFQIVQNLPKGLLDANELMEIATMKTSRGLGQRLGAGTPGFGGLSQKPVESRREQRRAHSQLTRASVQSSVRPSTPKDTSDAALPPLPALPPPPPPPGKTEEKQSDPSSASGAAMPKRRVTLRRLKSMKKIGN